MKNKRLFWGLIFLAAAVLVIVGQFGILGDIGLLKICFGILFAAFAVSGIFHRDYPVTLFSIAFLCCIFSVELHLEKLTPWPVFATALFGSIGLTLLLPTKKKPSTNNNNIKFDKVINDTDGSEVHCNTQMGSTVKYVNTTELSTAYINCNFGATKVYFDAAKVQNGHAVINVNVSFGGVEIYVPRDWNIIQNIDAFLGGVEIKGVPQQAAGPTIELNGNAKFSGITIYYV